ncbi:MULTISPECIES: FAD/NAD(P)-binding protein [unclassified Bradyrhizobium]|uniref:FAD/NAD(P)-binding protein n=1 Tax=unclassified Bradyrhizobium TaxID=2631580 RepID=UPI002915F385|nr:MULTISPECIES: FAD/NAD(P)-binding protein [unclassified Bradyrhizobium]
MVVMVEPIVSPVRICIVGGGPNCTYVLERLAAASDQGDICRPTEIHIFEKTGQFGAGLYHSAMQAPTSYLNRIVGQVSFGADETVAGGGATLLSSDEVTLLGWLGRQYARTGQSCFDLKAEDWPRRYVHGMALQDKFNSYIARMRSNPSVSVLLHCTEVVDIVEDRHGFTVRSAQGQAPDLTVEFIVLIAGHAINDAFKVEEVRRLAEFASASKHGRYIPYVYPLDEMIDPAATSPDRVVGCSGMGLTAIDLILFLTEGRGGRFSQSEDGEWLTYHPSGREPRKIVAFGTSGLFIRACAFNAKEAKRSDLEQRGKFFSTETLEKIRGRITAGSARVQLDFERHVWPLMLVEMATIYYRTLLGDAFSTKADELTSAALRAFVDSAQASLDTESAIAALLGPIDRLGRTVLKVVDALACGKVTNEYEWPFVKAVAQAFLATVYGPTIVDEWCSRGYAPAAIPDITAGRRSPWRHSPRPMDHVFSFDRLARPIMGIDERRPDAYRAAIVDFMKSDVLAAGQDNVRNPAKAACDGVWRDLRPVLQSAIDFGGLTPNSHRRFLRYYVRYHNQLATGPTSTVIKKILALIEQGVVDVSVGPNPVVDPCQESGRFRVRGDVGSAIEIDTLVHARLHELDLDTSASALVQNLRNRGLVRKWRNVGIDGTSFEPGGIDITADFHPLQSDGRVERRITLLGPLTEGIRFYQSGAARPKNNHHTLRDAAMVVAEIVEHMRVKGTGDRKMIST